VSSCLGNPEALFPDGTALSEYPQLGMAPGEVGACEHGEQVGLKALVVPRIAEGRYALSLKVDHPTIVALGLVGYAKAAFRYRLLDDIPSGRGEGEGALGSGDGLVIRASLIEME
jgi:hypothetical protein